MADNPPKTYATSCNALINHAKDVLYPYRCEWSTCKITLNSWRTIAKHVGLHCKQTKNDIYICAWKGCSQPGPFSKRKDLRRHVETQHVARLTIPCPVADCAKTFTLRHEAAIISHLQHEHPSSGNHSLQQHAWVFRRSAVPAPQQIRTLKNLPVEPVSNLAILDSTVSVRPSNRASQTPSVSQTTAAPSSQGHRRGRLETRGRAKDDPRDNSDELDCSDIFPDIPRFKWRKIDPELLTISADAQVQAEKQLSVPPPVSAERGTELRKPPDSFGFEYMERILNA